MRSALERFPSADGPLRPVVPASPRAFRDRRPCRWRRRSHGPELRQSTTRSHRSHQRHSRASHVQPGRVRFNPLCRHGLGPGACSYHRTQPVLGTHQNPCSRLWPIPSCPNRRSMPWLPCQLCKVFPAARFTVHAHHRLRARKPVAHPRSVRQDELQPVRPYNLGNLHARNSVGSPRNFSVNFPFHFRRQAEVLSKRIEGTNFGKYAFELLAQRGAATRHHLTTQQARQHAVLLGNVLANGQTGALLAANQNLVLLDQLTDVFETDRSFIKFDFVSLSQRVNKIGGSNRLSTPFLHPRVSTR